jgi:hypothetical protein
MYFPIGYNVDYFLYYRKQKNWSHAVMTNFLMQSKDKLKALENYTVSQLTIWEGN